MSQFGQAFSCWISETDLPEIENDLLEIEKDLLEIETALPEIEFALLEIEIRNRTQSVFPAGWSRFVAGKLRIPFLSVGLD